MIFLSSSNQQMVLCQHAHSFMARIKGMHCANKGYCDALAIQYPFAWYWPIRMASHTPLLDIIWVRDERIVDISFNCGKYNSATIRSSVLWPKYRVNTIIELPSGILDGSSIESIIMM